MSGFDDWLKSGFAGDETGASFSGRDLARFFARLNREIGSISENRSDRELAELIWYLYGSGSCYLSEISSLPLCDEVVEFFRSVPVLYGGLFEKRCTRFFSHLDEGPEPPSPLNGPCYMLWDMDCGIDSFWLTHRPEYVSESIRLLGELGESDHPATVESAIHGLGHMAHEYFTQCKPILERVRKRTDLPVELRTYGGRAIDLCIL